MTEHHVTWACEIDAASPVEAARKALTMLQDPSSIANVFTVDGEEVDLYLVDHGHLP